MLEFIPQKNGVRKNADEHHDEDNDTANRDAVKQSRYF